MPSILFLGATGYIGAAVFNAFINAHPALDYVALVRTPSHSSHIRTVNTVIGTFEDRALLTKLARDADIVVNVARADDLSMVEALVEGMKQRKEQGGSVSVFIHTCGGGVFGGRDTWNDADADTVNALLSRPLEQTILKADQQGILQAYFIAPTVVYGLNPYEKPSPFYLQIIRELLSLPSPPTSIQPLPFPELTSTAIKERPDRVLGMVNIEDLAQLYLLVLDTILRARAVPDSPAPSEEEDMSLRVYIASAYERTVSLLYHDVHRALVKRGHLDACNSPPESEDSEEARSSKPEPSHFLALRARTELGWEPTKPAWQHDLDWDIDRALEVLKVRPADSSKAKVA